MPEPGETKYEIVLRNVRGYGWLGIVLDGKGNEKYRTGTFYALPDGAFAQANAMAKELELAKAFD